MSDIKKINLFILLLLTGMARILSAETFTVTNWADSGPGSLREAVDASNTRTGITIAFAVSNSITVLTPISIIAPTIMEGGGTTIGSVGLDVLQLNAGSEGSIISDLAIVNGNSNNASGIYIQSDSNTISGCMIGTDWESHAGKGNYYGIYLSGNNNIIGGNTPETRNVISGNYIEYSSCGIYLFYAYQNQIKGNYIGTDRDGLTALGNHDGIHGSFGYSNIIGGDRNQGEGNLISGNSSGTGVLLRDNNIVSGNIVGLNRDQTARIPNWGGIWAEGTNNNIGINEPGKGNIVAGNQSHDIWLSGDGNIVQNNFIGISSNNTTFYHLSYDEGIQIWSSNNYIGSSYGPGNFAKNVISGKGRAIQFYYYNSDLTNNVICGNFIGTNIDGTLPRPNDSNVIIGNRAYNNLIGDYQSGIGNLIVSGDNGIYANTTTAYRNGIFGNTICGFSGKGISWNSVANNNKSAPEIQFANLSSIWGTAGSGDYVEIFKAERGSGFKGGSLSYLGYTMADTNGNWSLPTTGLSTGDFVCATASDYYFNTSELSFNVQVLNATPTVTFTHSPSTTITPTITASPSCTPTPTITLTGTETPTCTPTPTITKTFTMTPTFTMTSTATISPTIINVDLHGKTVVAYPNPARDQVRFAWSELGAEKVKISIYNLNGEQVASLNAASPGQSLVWNTSGIASGIYFYRVVLTVNGAEKTLPVQKLAIARP